MSVVTCLPSGVVDSTLPAVIASSIELTFSPTPTSRKNKVGVFDGFGNGRCPFGDGMEIGSDLRPPFGDPAPNLPSWIYFIRRKSEVNVLSKWRSRMYSSSVSATCSRPSTSIKAHGPRLAAENISLQSSSISSGLETPSASIVMTSLFTAAHTRSVGRPFEFG